MKFGLVAGEASGDALGAGLIRALRAAVPDATFEGVAGPAMLEAGCEQWEPSESLAVMGLIEPLRHVPRLLRLRRELARRWTESPPDVFVGIDAPDFNFGLEKKLRKAGVKTAHYVSPTIWAWRARRIKTVKKASDLVLCLLPFEPRIYAGHDIDAVFVGHPRANEAPGSVDMQRARRDLGVESEEVIAVMPGSRSGEVKRLGPVFAETIKRLSNARNDVQFVIPAARPDLAAGMREILLETGADGPHVSVLDGDAQAAMKAADVVLQASGTAVLEAALLCKPAVAAYRLAPLTWFMAKHLFRIRLAHVTLPNLLTEEPLVPEFLQHDAQPEQLAEAVISLLDDPERRDLISARFARLREELALDADQRAADAVLRLARR